MRANVPWNKLDCEAGGARYVNLVLHLTLAFLGFLGHHGEVDLLHELARRGSDGRETVGRAEANHVLHHLRSYRDATGCHIGIIRELVEANNATLYKQKSGGCTTNLKSLNSRDIN